MGFNVPVYVPSVVWQDRPAATTPLDATVLNAEIRNFAAYVESVSTAVGDYAVTYADSVTAGNTIATISGVGDVSGAYALDMSAANITICGTGRLVGDTVITVSGFAIGSRAEMNLIQDPTGGHAVSIVANGATTALTVPSSGAMTIRFTCTDRDLFFDVVPASAAMAAITPIWAGAIAALVNGQLDTTTWPYQSIAAGRLSVLTDPLGVKGTVLAMAITEAG